MIQQQRGKIVSVSAMPALHPAPKKGTYAVAKAGVITLMQTIAEEVKEHNIQANVIVPSIIATEANIQASPDEDYSKWVTPDQVAQLILFLSSGVSDGVTGAVIKIFGKV
jgi:NAD(P)-dependent dehydrogenase (short-subunit alcohol dehydrogenase family)